MENSQMNKSRTLRKGKWKALPLPLCFSWVIAEPIWAQGRIFTENGTGNAGARTIATSTDVCLA